MAPNSAGSGGQYDTGVWHMLGALTWISQACTSNHVLSTQSGSYLSISKTKEITQRTGVQALHTGALGLIPSTVMSPEHFWE